MMGAMRRVALFEKCLLEDTTLTSPTVKWFANSWKYYHKYVQETLKASTTDLIIWFHSSNTVKKMTLHQLLKKIVTSMLDCLAQSQKKDPVKAISINQKKKKKIILATARTILKTEGSSCQLKLCKSWRVKCNKNCSVRQRIKLCSYKTTLKTCSSYLNFMISHSIEVFLVFVLINSCSARNFFHKR
jgi:hypothetical protein